MKNYLKRTTTFILALLMLLSVPLQAFAEVNNKYNYDNLTKDQAEIINKKEVKPAKLENGQTAKQLIENPKQPAIYTLRTDYKVQRGEKYEVDYQPYIASVGEAATPDEQKKVKQEITLPDLAGYDKSHLEESYTIDYKTVKDAAEGKNESGNDANGKRYQAKEDYKYKAKANQIKIKHVFQDLYDFSKYTNPDGSVGEEGQLITTQNGNTGSTMEVTPLEEKDRKGFVPEADSINMQVPENAENFILEYRYNRAHYDVNFDTKGGTPVPSRTLYYEQTIPKIDGTSIPKKAGSIFQGWKPSVELKNGNGKIFKADEIIKYKEEHSNPVNDLDVNLKMPAENVTFTAVWKEKPKAEYVIQFWTEKTDYDDENERLPLRERYDFIGARRIDNVDTGSTPDLTNLDIHGITFPDLNDGRLEKAQNDPNEFARYYFLNKELTKERNASEENPNVQKSVLSTGETVYNVYYDRRVYTLYFTAPNDAGWDPSSSYWPTLTRNGKVIGTKGFPYKVEARFNQSLDKIWPKDKEISGLPPASGTPGVDMGPIGWTINVNEPGELIFRDTPPYRLSAEDFIDSQDVVGTGDYQGHGHGDQIPIGENQTKDRGKYEISLASSSWDESVVHHIDIIKDDFDGKEQIDYDLSYWKSDTNVSYAFILPHLQGFTLKEDTRDAEWVLAEPTSSQYRTINDVNRARNEKTPFRSDADKIEYIDKFPWGTKYFDGKNRYNFANYSRNKYKLKLNNDPKTVKNDGEYGAGNILDVPYELPLNDLKLDTTHKPEKPDWVRDDWSFLGWTLDPAGDNLVKDGNETKLHYDQVLYAKWGEPDYKWKVIFDPNGGSLRTIDENKLTTEHKTVKEGDIGQEIETTYPIKEKSEGDKQVFKVFHKQELVEPKFKPVRKGYDFLGWEIIRYKKDDKTGDYTEEIDDSYRKTYKVPELYSFGNEVVSPIYLKAIWVPNHRVDINVLHYYLDKDYNLDKNISPNPDSDTLEGKRANYLVATTGDRQDDKYTLVPHDELEAHKETSDAYSIYKEYNDRVGLNNSFFQTFRVEPAEIPDPEDSEKMIPNPDVKNNVFKFFYRPYRQREYKVNYIDESFKGKENEKDGAIIDQELVTNGNRHYDARNYRPIPGWVLTSQPQQQLFFDLNEETNELLGINGTGKDEITFYYKDVRVIEVPKDGKTPDGYVRVTFKADKGGSFTDNTGKSVTELHYDVIKGLKSDLLPVPQEWVGGKNDDGTEKQKEKDKYYITPDTGKKFTKWDEKPLLNKNTIVENEDKDFYVFTAKFEWSGLSANGLVRTESFKDPNKTWTNDFAPTIEDLKKQLEWREKDVVTKLPEGTKIQLFDEKGTELTTDDQVYELVNEKKAADKDELVRTVNVKAKVTFTDGKDPQELDIPITVYKNVYEALNKEGDKPLFLKEAEGKEAKDGGLKDVTGDYVMVKVKASKDFTAKDDKIYYVNKNAWVAIPEVKTDGSSTFVNWTADKAAQNEGQAENGIFDFEKRHKFTENTVISPSDAKDVVEQKEGEDKPKVPDTFVKVIVKTTDKATDESKFEKTFWVNPSKEVPIDVTNPTGKENQKFTFDGLGEKDVNYIFKEWQKVKAGEADDKLTDITPEKIDLSSHKYTDKVTVIEAAYKKSIQAETIDKPLSTTKLDTPQGKTIEDKDLIEKITPQEGKEIESITVVDRPSTSEPGSKEARVIVKYKDGSTQGTDKDPVVIPVEVHKNIIPEVIPGQRPDGAMENYVKVIFKAGTGGSLSGDLVYYVSPEVEVDMTSQAEAVTKTPSVGYTSNGGSWSPEIKSEKITEEKTYEFNFVKSKDIVEKTNDPNQVIPEGYVKVTFKTEDANKGKLEGDKEVKIYYVNPKAGIKLKVLEEGQTAGEKELAVPKTLPAKNYVFDKWQEVIDEKNPITNEKEHVAMFQAGQVSLTYEKGGDDVTGDLPAKATAKYGEKVGLAGPGNLAKPNATFAGWKLDEDETIYQPGDQVTLEKARTATAQWTTSKHKVTFNTMGGTDVSSQEVVHGEKLATVTPPTQKDKVFMGWKEEGKENEEAYFDLTSAINEDKILIAIWQDPVQKINDGDTVEEQFIKVTFLKGSHGSLKEGQVEGIEKVTYKVAKGLSFEEAKGLIVPEIVPNKYYKVKQDKEGEAPKFGWDKELKLEKQNAEFIAQYEPEADVIPVDPEVTDETQIENEKPEGMILVTFSVDENKAFMVGDTKFYVKANTKVDIPTPVVHPITFENDEPNDYEFKGWSYEKDAEGRYNFIFTEDTSINDGNLVKPIISLRNPRPNATIVYVAEITEGATAFIEVTRGSNPPILIEAVKNNDGYIVFNVPAGLGGKLKRRDKIRAYSKLNNVESDIREYRVR